MEIDTIAGRIDPLHVQQIWCDTKPPYTIHITMNDYSELCHTIYWKPSLDIALDRIADIWRQIKEAKSQETTK